MRLGDLRFFKGWSMKHQVLIVEDNEINSEMLSAILTD